MSLYEESIKLWRKLGSVPPSMLGDAVAQIHWASQLLAAFTDACADSCHSGAELDELRWYDDYEALVVHKSATGHRVGLRISDLTIILLDGRNLAVEEMCLHGHSLQQALAWLNVRLRKSAICLSTDPLAVRDYAIPHHRIRDGAPFSTKDSSTFIELSNWYANAALALEDVAGANKGATPVRCTLPQMNLCTRVMIEALREGDEPGQVTIGMCPGDCQFAEPYVYVMPWPFDERVELPDLCGSGFWQRDQWFGAVLKGSDLVLADSPEVQARQLSDFLRSAVDAALDLANSYRFQHGLT